MSIHKSRVGPSSPFNSRVPIGSTRIQSVCQEEKKKKGISSSADKKDTEIRNHGKQIPDYRPRLDKRDISAGSELLKLVDWRKSRNEGWDRKGRGKPGRGKQAPLLGL
jgi:hypothetical protein